MVDGETKNKCDVKTRKGKTGQLERRRRSRHENGNEKKNEKKRAKQKNQDLANKRLRMLRRGKTEKAKEETGTIETHGEKRNKKRRSSTQAYYTGRMIRKKLIFSLLDLWVRFFGVCLCLVPLLGSPMFCDHLPSITSSSSFWWPPRC